MNTDLRKETETALQDMLQFLFHGNEYRSPKGDGNSFDIIHICHSIRNEYRSPKGDGNKVTVLSICSDIAK